MSGFPHGLDAPPHGDALLPNRTGGGMNVREALNKMLAPQWDGEGGPADELAPHVERALRAERTAGYLAGFRCANDGGLSDETAHKWAEAAGKGKLTAGVAAMVEGS